MMCRYDEVDSRVVGTNGSPEGAGCALHEAVSSQTVIESNTVKRRL